jgi:hypothetical protein
MKRMVLATLILLLLPASGSAADSLESGWENTPREARLRAYWWWLNGCVTKQAITRDLEEMKAKGFGGAMICDADGSSQDGNERAPHGPTFLSAEWRELYRHALREADRLGLEMSLNIQSGWNLGGPMVTADDAGKKLVWSEMRLDGPAEIEQELPSPSSRDGYYRDAYVLAYPLRDNRDANSLTARVSADSKQAAHPVELLADGDPTTFWVSEGDQPGAGPSCERPVAVHIEFADPVRIDRLRIQPRPGYGPQECDFQVAGANDNFRTLAAITVDEEQCTGVDFDAVQGRAFRLLISSAFDPRFPQQPRNVQIAELTLGGPDGIWPGVMRRPLRNWQQKAGHKPLHFSAPDTTLLLEEDPSEPGEEDTAAADVIDLTDQLDSDGFLRWEAPSGSWQVLRMGYTISDRAHVSTSSEGWTGYSLDVLDAGAFHRYWNAVVEPLIADAGPFAGTALKYLHTDSWEIEPLNWTPTLCAEFQQRRGYDPLPWLPVLTGRIVESRNASNRFLHDFRKTLGDLVLDHHYRLFREGAHRHGLSIHPESGGPHAVPIDAQRCLGFNDVPMSEFWAWSWRHRIGDDNRFFVKQPASAAHTYGRHYVAAEGFTTIGPHWQETLWDNLKPSFDKACCEGMNLLFWHEFVCSPVEQGLPGIQYFAGTHLNPNVTWWSKSEPFFSYINRCQFLLQQGLFVADACYYYGDHVPNFAQHKRTDPAHVLPGYDYDVLTEEALLTRASVREGRIVLPDGMSYQVLVLRDHRQISLPVLRRVKEFVEAGATVIGSKPSGAMSLLASDSEVQQLADALWDQGSVIADRTAREVLAASGVKPDFEFRGGDDDTDLDYIHRRVDGTEIYFVANRNTSVEDVTCVFRVAGKAPELWDPVSGNRRFAAAYTETEGRTMLPLEFAPCGSWFVVFREPAARHPSTADTNAERLSTLKELGGPWQVTFDPEWSGPGTVEFADLASWTERKELGIKFYSGTAVYQKSFELPDGPRFARESPVVWLDLGEVRELAEVKLNDQPCGIVWSPPFRVDIGDAVKPGVNHLEIEVVNFWPNRLIGDDALPPEERRTRTNIRKLTKDTELMKSGLLGPVTLGVSPGP